MIISFLNAITLAAVVVILFSIYTLSSATWNSPPKSPPNNNVSQLMNIGTSNQVKTGSLASSVASASDHMRSPRYCDENGQNCLTISSLFQCPYTDTTSTADGDCGTTCAGQVSTNSFCQDFEQYREKTHDRRCRVRRTIACTPLPNMAN
jgi:hypothetical protein